MSVRLIQVFDNKNDNESHLLGVRVRLIEVAFFTVQKIREQNFGTSTTERMFYDDNFIIFGPNGQSSLP